MLGEPAPAHTCCQIAFAASLYHRGATSVLDIYKGQWKYYKYFLWGAYLFFQFDGGTRSDPDDDLLFRMLTEETWGPPQYRRAHLGLYGLSQVLQNADYNSVAYLDSTRFPDSVENSQEIGQERLKRIFHNFMIALWVNDAGVGEGQYAFDENWDPAERTPIWRDVQKGGNAAVVPPNLWLSPEGTNLTQVAQDEWIDPHDGDTRPLAMWAWSHELMNFQASPQLDTSGDLKIRISQVDSLMTSTDDAYSYDLRASLVAYDVADTNLHRRGDHVLFVQDLETVVPTASNDSLLVEVTVPDFGSKIKAASLVMSMTEHNTPADSTAMLAIPNAKLEVVKYKVEYTLVD